MFRHRRNALRGWLFSAASSRLHTTDCQGVKCVQLGYVLSSRNGSELSGPDPIGCGAGLPERRLNEGAASGLSMQARTGCRGTHRGEHVSPYLRTQMTFWPCFGTNAP